MCLSSPRKKQRSVGDTSHTLSAQRDRWSYRVFVSLLSKGLSYDNLSLSLGPVYGPLGSSRKWPGRSSPFHNQSLISGSDERIWAIKSKPILLNKHHHRRPLFVPCLPLFPFSLGLTSPAAAAATAPSSLSRCSSTTLLGSKSTALYFHRFHAILLPLFF
jgi:hypothetical protein